MGFQDRPYYHEQQSHGFGSGGMGRLGLPRVSRVVKYLLIINCVVFVLQLLGQGRLELLFAATGYPPSRALEIWRLITFQFLHDTHWPFHLLFNMVGLFFLGPILERSWGPKRFLTFYLACGAVGGALFVAASEAGAFGGGNLIGASGGVLGLLVACAIMFPQIRVVVILFPMPIRTAAVLFAVIFGLIVLTSGANAGGHLCHLGGMATAYVWVMGKGHMASWKRRTNNGAYQRKILQRHQQQIEVDRILAKVHSQGIQSLTRTEKKILQQATEEQKRSGSG